MTLKLISESSSFNTKTKILENNNKKQYFLEGIMMQAEVINKNNRLYPLETLEREVARYKKEYINENRAYGSTDHPDDLVVLLKDASHIVTQLEQNGDNFIGKIKILSNPNGNFIKNFIDDGVQLAVSSRGVGSIRFDEDRNCDIVEDDFNLICIDIVADPSAPASFVNGILEGREFIKENGLFKELKKELNKTNVKRKFDEDFALNLMKKYLDSL